MMFARFLEFGSTFSDPQIVTGTLGRLAGAFLMQLVNSPSSRPPFAHLWSFGVPAIYSGSGTAVPIFDAWANQDTDIEPLAVDIGTQTLSAGAYGTIFRGTKDDSQALVFMGAGVGGASGSGGSPQWYGNGIDGDVTLSPGVNDAVYSAGSGGWATDTQFPLFISIDGSALASFWGSSGPNSMAMFPGFDASKTYVVQMRDGYFRNLTLAANVILIPCRSLICGTGTLSGPGVVDNGGNAGNYVEDCYQTVIFKLICEVLVVSYGRANLVPFQTGLGPYPPGFFCLIPSAAGAAGAWVRGAPHPGNANGTNGLTVTGSFIPPFDETTAPPSLNSGVGGAGGGHTGGIGNGSGTPRGHPINTMPASAMDQNSPGNPGGSFNGGASGAAGGGSSPDGGAQGGKGGAPLLIRFKTIAYGGGLTISSNGGDGLAANTYGGSGNAGGGGGGNPGFISVLSDSLDPAVVFSVQPGAGGAGAGTGTAGGAGRAVGYVYRSSPDATTTVGTS